MTQLDVDSPDRVMMMSVHPRHVAKILDGTKTVELRRARPTVPSGQPVAIYATVPSAALVATCRITKVEAGPPSEIWSSVRRLVGITRAEYDNYFEGASLAVALHLDDVVELEKEVTLSHLRGQGSFHPPQT
jgi:predicted transcriptional regulator